jgi:hypothetical protein
MSLILRGESEPAPEEWGKEEAPAGNPSSTALRSVYNSRDSRRLHSEAFLE